MWAYVGFFILTFVGGVLSGNRPPEHSCPKNEHFTRNDQRCIRTCANKWVPISYDCKPHTGCICSDDLVRLNDDGTGDCISEDECPCRDDPKHPRDQVSTAHAEALAIAEATHEDTVSDCDGKSLHHSSSKSSSLAKSSSSYKSVTSCDCEGKKCSDPNAVYKDRLNPCPLTCAHPNPGVCNKMPINKGGCECAKRFVLNEATGLCVRPKDCPENQCRDRNAVYKDCPNPCPLSCDHPFPKACTKACKKSGCECAPDFILDFDDSHGKCIRPENCPDPIRCPKHSRYVINYNECPKTCGNRLLPNSDVAGACVPFTGCACDPGYVRKYDNATGPCIKKCECPPIPTHCGVNEVPTSCAIVCPPQTCDSSFSQYYCLPTDCKPGCDCQNGFLRNKEGDCIPSEDCFKPDPIECNGPNEIYSDCAITCPPQTCERLFKDFLCATDTICAAGCNCLDGFLRNSLGICVPIEECCNDSIRCPKYSHCVINDNQYPKTCGNRLLPNNDVAGACVPFTGCACDPGYVRKYDNATGPCIKECECPPIPTHCGVNEVPTSCAIVCPPQTCESIFSKYYCLPTDCKPGCDCLNGFLRNKDGDCIPSDDCFKPDPIECNGPNEIYSDCAITCPPQTCESLFVDYLCAADSICAAGCNCLDGFLRNSLGKCVTIEECYNDPAGCGGDLNATRSRGCSSPCPPTCDNPEPEASDETVCLLNACECKTGYIVSCDDGNCILASDCPGGSPKCGANKTYVGCKFGCPTNYCPADDSRGLVACSLPRFCQGGCACIAGHLIVSREDPRCVLASDCPEVECTRQNEVWDPNPSSCFTERCEDRGTNCDYPYPPGPRCVCEEGFYRNGSEICVPEYECPPLGCKGDLNATLTYCPNPCPKTCDDTDAGDDGCIEICLEEGCQCNSGYLKTKKVGGICIKPEDCESCKGDPNAMYSFCPSACEPTCTNPNPYQRCTRQCMPPGCICRKGFVLNEETGKCIKSDCCPSCGGDPNAVYSTCPSACEPTCDNPEPQICTLQCLPHGCVCRPGFVKSANGKCIKPENCPDKGCNGDLNATHSDCASSCPPTCESRYSQEKVLCPAVCDPIGCVCKQGYILTKKGGKCVLPEDCPVPECEDPNAVYKECTSACEPTCANPNPICIMQCMPPRCVCKSGFVTSEDGKCIKLEDCPGCGGDPNAIYSDCPSACEPTCAKPYPQICTLQCLPPGCICKQGFFKSVDGKCIKLEDCPAEPQCKGDRNATYVEDASYYQATCKNPDPEECDMPKRPGCVCKEGFLKKKSNGPCIKPEDCPGGWPTCRANETYVYCKVNCPTDYCPVDDSLDMIACDPTFPCPGGCICRGGYLKLSEDNDYCILSSECPQVKCTRPNEVWDPHAPGCLHERCDDRHIPCDFQYPGPPKCRCIKGYYRNQDNICVPECKCPEPEPICGYNEVAVPCRQICPPQNCEIAYTDYACTEETKICEPGCDCLPDHLRNGSGICIPNEECTYPSTPVCGINEIARDCRQICPPQTCLSKYALFKCAADLPCEPGCDCVPNYLRDHRGICILSEKCPPPCQIPDECKRTCAEPNPPNCAYTPPEENMNGCDCKDGYLLSEIGGDCIPIDQCPPEIACHGDPNARPKRCPKACPSTCTSPNQFECKRMCEPIACECKSGFIRLDDTEFPQCILPDQCPGGNPCGKNGRFVNDKTDCPDDYCPVDDSRDPQSCTSSGLSGCICNVNHKKKSRGDPRCIVSSECPPVNCTRPNEKWSPCPSACLAENCDDRDNQPTVCNTLVLNCQPRCICEDNYFRNASGICVCADDCPKPECDGDLNATFSKCPNKCPATCCEPDSDRGDPNDCDNPGCVCNEGFILSKPGGPCIRPWDCDGGSPHCCENMTYTSCKIECPMNYCPQDENEIMVICDPVWPCPTGCVCKPGYLMPNTGPKICILAADCPPFECTRPNEVWDPSPSICKYERCDEMYYECEDPTPGRPKCVCKPGYYRNNDGVCIPAQECHPSTPVCGINEVARDCRRICPPQICQSKYIMFNCLQDLPCEPGCDCVPNYLRDERGICIPSEQCPPAPEPEPICGYNEVAVLCRQICPPQNCEIAYTEYACTKETKICEPGCDCRPDHLRNGSGICIPNDECPYPSTPVCAINEIARDCRRICPPQTCLSKYALFRCVEDLPCEPGCDCVPNYLRDKRGICIPSEQCPALEPETICGYNEVAVPCRQICPPQNCEIAYTEYACTEESKICEPGCDCRPDHLRNGSGICIPNDECPYPSTPVCGINEIARDCRRICPPQTCLSKYALFKCAADLPCEPGCDCVPNYLRDHRGICILSEKCPPPCQIPDECKRTCAAPNPPNCAYKPPKENMNGCDCKDGYLLSEIGGDCIPIDQCPPEIACHGDPNARPKRCPKPCPSSCTSPNQRACKRICEPIACECKPGFIRLDNTEFARCILPDECPGGNPCGKNGRFVNDKADCPDDYCPVDDSRDPQSCTSSGLSGCICNLNHKKESRGDPRCIVSSECPPVNCTRPNEKWSPCPSACLAENCEDRENQPTVCNTLVLNCQPRCICEDNYFRNASGICVCADDCPPLGCGGDPNAVWNDCPSACEPTCSNPEPEVCTDQCMPGGCVCKEGFVLNEEDGKCTRPEECCCEGGEDE